MALINVKLRNSTYTLASNDDARVLELAGRFNTRLESIVGNTNNATDNKLVLIAGLMLEDELEKVQTELNNNLKKNSEAEATSIMSETLDQIASYIEHLADRLEKV